MQQLKQFLLNASQEITNCLLYTIYYFVNLSTEFLEVIKNNKYQKSPVQ